MGFDDVGAINWWTTPHLSLLTRTILNTGANRWRPVFTTLFTLETIVFGKSYEPYFWFNVALTLLLALLVYRLVLRVSSSVILGAACAALVVTSRFAYYQVTQALGPVEALSLVFLVLLVGAVVEFERSGRAVHLGLAALWYALIINTHERYIMLFLFLALVVVTARVLTRRARVAWCAVFAGPVVFNLAMKHFYFHLPLLVGTGSSTNLGFTWTTGIQFYVESVLNVVGINNGPAYLDGLVYPSLSGLQQAGAVALAELTALVVLAAFFAWERGTWLLHPGRRRSIMLGLALVAVLILGISVTIRVEPRFLYAPFVVMLMLFVCCLSLLARRRAWRAPAAVVAVAFVVVSVILNIGYSDNLGDVYFMVARTTATQEVQETVDRYGRLLLTHRVYVVDPTPGANWGLTLDPVIMANSSLGAVNVTTVAQTGEVPKDSGAIVYEAENGSLVPETPPAAELSRHHGAQAVTR